MHSREREIFEAALNAPAERRHEIVAKAAGGDEELAARVLALLDAHEQAGRDTTGLAPESDLLPPAPEKVGPYRILEPLGEGGMGSVYLAAQREPVRRRVALKVIKAGMDTKEVIARFAQERQALAMMSHPNIARLIDAGATDDGRPYFVMEHVRGIPLNRYCDQRLLPIEGRLELFAEICRAVQHAHERGILHRDLKPGNILVSEEADRARPMVIDFGIAKAVAPHLTDRTVHTQIGVAVGTPAYMSPEQASASPLPLDGRTDVYSLGALLYEVLAGSTPLALSDAAPDDARRRIVEELPPPPSARLRNDATAAEIAASRGTTPGRLAQRLRGDLDSIVMKAIEKDPVDRYETAAALAADVERAISGRPIVASRPGAGFRLRRLLRSARTRRLAGVAGVGGVLALIGLLAWKASHRAPPPPGPIRWQQATFRGDVRVAATSPDGSWLTYVAAVGESQEALFAKKLADVVDDRPVEILRAQVIGSLDWSADSQRLLLSRFDPGGQPEGLRSTTAVVERDSWKIGHLDVEPAPLMRWVNIGRIASGSARDRSIRIADVERGEAVSVPIRWEMDWLIDLEASPDGESLLVVSQRGGETTLGRLELTGGAAQVVVRSTRMLVGPRWSPDGRSIRYVVGEGSDGRLMQLELPRSEAPPSQAEELVSGAAPGWESGIARLSTDFVDEGRRWPFVRQEYRGDLHVVTLSDDAEGVQARRLTSGTTLKSSPAISPDGRFVAFAERRGPSSEVYRMPLEGGAAERLTHLGGEWIMNVAWSPDGREIAFSVWGGDNQGVWTLDSTGAGARLVPDTEFSTGEVVWTPDGALWARESDNRDYRIVRGPGAGRRVFGSGDDDYRFAVRPSPDGTQVLSNWNRPDERGMFLRTLADGSEEQLLPERETATPVDWAPDGKSVFFVDRRDVNAIFELDLDTRDVKRFALPLSPTRDDIVLLPDGSGFVIGVEIRLRDVWIASGLRPWPS